MRLGNNKLKKLHPFLTAMLTFHYICKRETFNMASNNGNMFFRTEYKES